MRTLPAILLITIALASSAVLVGLFMGWSTVCREGLG